MWQRWLCSCCLAFAVAVASGARCVLPDDGAGAFGYHHIQYPFHSYNVRDDDDVDLVAAAAVAVVVH